MFYGSSGSWFTGNLSVVVQKPVDDFAVVNDKDQTLKCSDRESLFIEDNSLQGIRLMASSVVTADVIFV